MNTTLPILYSFRRCPYAMRARLGIAFAELNVELCEVALKNKPAAMLAISPKGTVPVLQLPNGQVIEESIEIVEWALATQDPQGLLNTDLAQADRLIQQNDQEFKHWLDRYKYSDRYPEQSQLEYRQQG
ncbi:MAG: glutathione S-transferase N-terminal domain-containing protein, partial [Venatoribacter sp.]